MFDFHKDKKRYFEMQYTTSKEYILPFIGKYLDLSKKMEVLELGCAEAGVLKAFTNLGHKCTGIELSEGRIKLAEQFLSEELEKGLIRFNTSNLFDLTPGTDGHLYDLIILKDVIEHIPDQEAFIPYLSKFLKPNGVIFFGFPPWLMPFGGHQQLCRNKYLKKMPWIHLLPKFIYSSLLKMGESEPKVITELLEIHDTGITIERFNRICINSNHKMIAKKYWLFNPIYEWKFNLSPKEVPTPLHLLPYVRDFYTTAYYALVQKK